MKVLYVLAAVALACGPAAAADWKSSEDKGLKLYRLVDGANRLDLVCDPEGLWEPPEFHLFLSPSGSILNGASLTATKDEESVTLPLVAGAVVSRQPDLWNKLIGMISEPGTVTFISDATSVAITFDASREGDCLRPLP